MGVKPTVLRKLTAIVFFLILLYSQSGYFLLYLCTLYQLKAQIREQLKRGTPGVLLEEICYTDHQASIRWEEEDEEFSWNDQMYDVAGVSFRNGKKYLLCLADEKEDTLIRQMCAAALHNDKKNGHRPTTRVADDFTLHGNLHIFRHPVIIPTTYPCYKEQLLQPVMPVTVPPPRC